MKTAWALLLLVLASITILPNLVSSFVWGPINMAYAIVVSGSMLFLALKARGIARLAVVPLAAVLTLPPIPYWLFSDNRGAYRLTFNGAGITDSIDLVVAFFVGYSIAFILIYLVCGKLLGTTRTNVGNK